MGLIIIRTPDISFLMPQMPVWVSKVESGKNGKIFGRHYIRTFLTKRGWRQFEGTGVLDPHKKRLENIKSQYRAVNKAKK